MVTVQVGGNIGAKQVLSWLIRLFFAPTFTSDGLPVLLAWKSYSKRRPSGTVNIYLLSAQLLWYWGSKKGKVFL